MYNDKTYYEYEFRRIQESRRNPAEGTEPERYHTGDKNLSVDDRRYLAGLYEGILGQHQGDCSSSRRFRQWTDLKGKNCTFVLQEVSSQIFRDIFEINRSFLKYGELVDLHDDYSNCRCYLTSDGLGGFAIDEDNNLVSVFSLYDETKRGFLHSIKDVVIAEGATHCDCYDSKLQPLPYIYEKTFGWQEASRMRYNMAFDHDNIAERHGYPDVVFMVWSPKKVEKKEFSEDQYDEAVAYQTECSKDAFYQEMDEFVARGSILAYGELKDGWSLIKLPNGMYNYRNVQGEFLAKRANLDAATEFKDGYAVVIQKGTKYLIDTTGEVKKNLSQSEIQDINRPHKSCGRRR